MGKRLVMVIDSRRCAGCHTCTVACREENGLPEGHFNTRVRTVGPAGTFPHLRMAFRPEGCLHCSDAPCACACPSGACLRREDGIVRILADECSGCGQCVDACRERALSIDPRSGAAHKCDFCAHLIDRGAPPRCVQCCPMNALLFGDVEEPGSEVVWFLSAAGVAVGRSSRIYVPEWEACDDEG